MKVKISATCLALQWMILKILTYIGRLQRNRRVVSSPPPPTHTHVTQGHVFKRTLDGLPRTNNMLEAWHGVMQRSLQAKHQIILKFIQLLQKEQELQEFNLAQSRVGRDLTQRLKKYIIVNKVWRGLYKINSHMIHSATPAPRWGIQPNAPRWGAYSAPLPNSRTNRCSEAGEAAIESPGREYSNAH